MMNGYDPNQPRDFHGRWTDAGAAIQAAASDKADSGYKAEDAIADYTGGDYAEVNGFLRGSKQGSDVTKAQVRIIDKFIAEAPKESGEFHRGLSLKQEEFNGLLQNARPGAILIDKGFISTSTAKEVSRRFSEYPKLTSRYPVNVKIAAKNAVNISRLNASNHQDEREYLLPRGTKFKVLSAEKKVGQDGREFMNLNIEEI